MGHLYQADSCFSVSVMLAGAATRIRHQARHRGYHSSEWLETQRCSVQTAKGKWLCISMSNAHHSAAEPKPLLDHTSIKLQSVSSNLLHSLFSFSSP